MSQHLRVEEETRRLEGIDQVAQVSNVHVVDDDGGKKGKGKRTGFSNPTKTLIRSQRALAGIVASQGTTRKIADL